ncbi:MAG: ribosome biogenesis GTPase Der [Enterobacteriaceae bacterium]
MKIVSIIGRENVGKSTIFNKITAGNNSITSKISGTTSDIKYMEVKIKNFYFLIADTFGIKCSNPVKCKCKKILHLKKLIKLSEIILFVLDVKAGLLKLDQEIFYFIKKNNKNILLVINKIDSIKNLDLFEFYSFGINNLFPISSEFNIGIDKLINFFKNKLNIKKKKLFLERDEKDIIKISVVGYVNSGKSTLVNNILGEERVLTNKRPNTTHDSIYTPFKYLNQRYIIIDTAGICKKKRKDFLYKKYLKETIFSINFSDVVLIVLDASKNLSKKELLIIKYVLKKNKIVLILVNKIDLINKKDHSNFKNYIKFKLKFLKIKYLYFISAISSNKLTKILKVAKKIYSSINLCFDNLKSILNLSLKKTIYKNVVKIKFIKLKKKVPLVIKIYGKNVSSINKSNIKFICRFIRRKLILYNFPIKIKLFEY